MQIENISEEEFIYIEKQLMEYNSQKTNLLPDEVFEGIYRCVKSGGKIIGGISGDIELESALHIKILWIDYDNRGKKIGTMLLRDLEKIAIDRGAQFAYLETFDFQAKGFYMKNGYEVFSCLEYSTGNVIYFMKKQFAI